VKHKIVRLIVILVLLSAAGGGYWYFQQHPDQLSQIQLRLGLIDETEASGGYSVSGFIEAEEVNVAAEIKGRITRLAVEEGDLVQAGQTLVELDTALLEAQMQQAQTKVAAARAQLAKIEAGVRSEEIAKAAAAVNQAQAGADAARLLWQDAITLRDNPQELDIQIEAAQTALQLAELRIEQAIPLKEAAVAMNELQAQQVKIIEEGEDLNFELPPGFRQEMLPPNVKLREDTDNAAPGDEISAHVEFPEGTKQQASVNWNLATADEWERWVNLNSAQAAYVDAQATLNDLLTLRNDPQAAQVKVAQAEATYQTSVTQVEVARAQLKILQAGAGKEEIAVARAAVRQAEASLTTLQVQYDQHTLAAPLTGWVVEQPAGEGEMANPGATLLTLADLHRLTLIVYVPASRIGLVSVGQQVEVFVDTFPGEPFVGEIIFINDEAEFTPKNVQSKEERVNTVFAIKIRLEDETQRLKPGMPADVILATGPEL
jgi:multidrug efflux pump subunit AcrA (membrane-fusion protein)